MVSEIKQFAGRFKVKEFHVEDLNPTVSEERIGEISRRIIDNLDKMVHAVRGEGKLPMLFNVPYANESMFASHIAEDTHQKRDYHNERLRECCRKNGVPLADICSHLRDEHFGDELHPNEAGARVIALRVYEVLRLVHDAG